MRPGRPPTRPACATPRWPRRGGGARAACPCRRCRSNPGRATAKPIEVASPGSAGATRGDGRSLEPVHRPAVREDPLARGLHVAVQRRVRPLPRPAAPLVGEPSGRHRARPARPARLARARSPCGRARSSHRPTSRPRASRSRSRVARAGGRGRAAARPRRSGSAPGARASRRTPRPRAIASSKLVWVSGPLGSTELARRNGASGVGAAASRPPGATPRARSHVPRAGRAAARPASPAVRWRPSTRRYPAERVAPVLVIEAPERGRLPPPHSRSRPLRHSGAPTGQNLGRHLRCVAFSTRSIPLRPGPSETDEHRRHRQADSRPCGAG